MSPRGVGTAIGRRLVAPLTRCPVPRSVDTWTLVMRDGPDGRRCHGDLVQRDRMVEADLDPRLRHRLVSLPMPHLAALSRKAERG